MDSKASYNKKPNEKTADNTNPAATKSNAISIPQISLPKGGGALKGIDEKFSVNPVNGTAGFSIPVPVTPGRNGFQPALSVSYNSGSGNSPYGLGWNIDYASIQRKTDQRLPRYKDREDSDVFMFSGAEDLVPVLKETAVGWVRDELVTGDFTIRKYRPRIEGGFSRIERIARDDSAIFYWKITSSDNIVTFFGKSDSHRIANPADPSKVFKWLPEISFDSTGNCILFEYKEEDLDGVEKTLNEKNRLDGLASFTNRYIKRIKYGNIQPFYPDYSLVENIYAPASPGSSGFLFETVFDYGEHSDNGVNETNSWPFRNDAFSEYRSGFEIRTYRLCRRVLIFHHFTNQEFGLPGNGDERIDYLVRSLDFTYGLSSEHSQQPSELTYLKSIKQTGYIRDGMGYKSRSLPAIEFSYQLLNWNTQTKNIDPGNIMNAPSGLSNNNWVDLFNEGIPGILAEQATGWYYKSNLGNGEFASAKLVSPKPSVNGLSRGILQLQDLDADGNKQIVSSARGLSGFFELTDDNSSCNFQPFEDMPVLDWEDKYARLLDLQGDGKADILITEDNVFSWYPSAGKKGFENKETVSVSSDEEKGPAVVFADAKESIFLADMSGDGMTDIVRIRNGNICYWPNLGYGRFGAKVSMNNAPLFDGLDHFNPACLHLADISGTGATDIIYTGQNSFKAFLNLSGNGWSPSFEIHPFLTTEKPNEITVIDLLGNGTSCIVWSSPLPANSGTPLRYIDLMGGKKPHVLTDYKNNLGKEISFSYRSSSAYYLEDKKNGTPWVTKLPFPVQCISQVTTTDRVSNIRFTNRYSYHHGYFDHPEREFRGFGMVEQTDTEEFESLLNSGAANATGQEFYDPPTLIRTWFHTGASIRNKRILDHYTQEYWYNQTLVREAFGDLSNTEYALPGALMTGELSARELREAHRACKGMILRKEIFALDGSNKELLPYSVETHNCQIKKLQPAAGDFFAVFIVQESEAITFSFERNVSDPRVSHSLNIETDELGNVLKKASVVYKRKDRPVELADDRIWAEQDKTHVIINENSFTTDIIQADVYRPRLPYETKQFEAKGLIPSMAGNYFSINDLSGALTEIGYEGNFTPGLAQKRLTEHIKTIYLADDLINPKPQGTHDSLAFSYESYQLAFTPSLVDAIYTTGATTLVNEPMLLEAKYMDLDNNGHWWIRSGTFQYFSETETADDAPQRFFVVQSCTNPFGSVTTLTYDAYFLLLLQTKDQLDNAVSVEKYDLRFLSPVRLKDVNANITEAAIDILGMVAGIAVMGKGDEADSLDNFEPDESPSLIDNFFTDPVLFAPQLLKQASSRIVYDFSRIPCSAATIIREEHYKSNNDSKLQYSFEYSNGLGNVVLKKVQAQPGDAPHRDATGKLIKNADGSLHLQSTGHRWVGNGRTVLNNKGKPVKQYEPYFMDSHSYETEPELTDMGVTALLHYDSAGRLVKTDMPDETFSTMEYDSWQQKDFDANDNVTASEWYTRRINPSPDDLAAFIAEGKDAAKEKAVAEKTAIHANTPVLIHLDSMGRSVCNITHNKRKDFPTDTIVEEFYSSFSEFDIEGNLKAAIDACNNVVMSYTYNMLGQLVYQQSMDAGERWILNNCMGSPFFSRDNKEQQFKTNYDVLQRPITVSLTIGTATTVIVERQEYKDTKGLSAADLLALQQFNLTGKSVKRYDNAGITDLLHSDFKGNVLETSRQLCNDYTTIPHWPVLLSNEMEAETFFTVNEYDALSRPVKNYAPHTSIASASVIKPLYNESNLLDSMEANIQGDNVSAAFVTSIDYSAKGQRRSIKYSNNTVTRFTFDKKTFRLLRLLTTSNNGTDIKQDLRYVYDAVGNITYIQDHSQAIVFHDGEELVAANEYDYDAIYRLTRARGREQLGGDNLQVLRNYTQFYSYDAVDNILQMQHVAKDAGWTRRYWYNNNDADRNELVILPGNIKNNHLLQTQVGTDTAVRYDHDIQGNILNLPHLPEMNWNYRNQLQRADLGGGGVVYYVYDGSGQRIRKVIEKNGGRKEERLYLGVVEIYTVTNSAAGLIKQTDTLHIMDNTGRIAMVDMPVIPGDDGEEEVRRFIYANHIGSSSLELNENGVTISYEEYHPFGTTSISATNAAIKAAAKRYRYTGMEKDDETGMSYHSARYYLSWLGRWLSADPKGMADGGCLYCYCVNNPVVRSDTAGTDSDKNPKRTYVLGLGFNSDSLVWNPQSSSEANTNLTLLAMGGLDLLTPLAYSKNTHLAWKVIWNILVGAAMLSPTVWSHEGGHYLQEDLQGTGPDLHLWLGIFPYEVGRANPGNITNAAIIYAGGVNQNMLNARKEWTGFELSGWKRSFPELAGYWLNQGYLLFYNLRNKYGSKGNTNDIENYIRNSGADQGDLLHSASVITGLNVLSELFSRQFQGLTGGRLSAPRFEEYLTTNGDPLIGVQTMYRHGGRVPPIEVTAHTNLSLEIFSVTAKAHDIPISDDGDVTLSPFIGVTGGGVSGGADLTYKFGSTWGMKLTGGYRNNGNPFNEIEGVPAGGYGTLNLTMRFGRR
jgi:RHS repeat-associated protein